MHGTRFDLLERFKNPEFIPHPDIKGLSTFSFLPAWKGAPILIELPRIKAFIQAIDYFHRETPAGPADILRFQQDQYRLWFQIEGQGILQNVTRNTFGTARPGLLGVMGPGERHTYLHQKSVFECFTMSFSLMPSAQAKCYWNSEIEGKTVLPEPERIAFENLVFEGLYAIDNGRDALGFSPAARCADMLSILFSKRLLVVEEEQFPKNRAKSLVALARNYMNVHYGALHHQRDLETECGRDINYLNILFKKESGKTLYEYLTGVRMEHAKYLLENSGDPVSDIAGHIGYPNANSFTRVFKKENNLTPTEYRIKNRRPLPAPAGAASQQGQSAKE